MSFETLVIRITTLIAQNYGIVLRKQANHFDRLVQERRNSIAKALKLRLSCIIPSISALPLHRFAQNI